MDNLLVDNIDKARLNRERVSKGYGNEGYDFAVRHGISDDYLRYFLDPEVATSSSDSWMNGTIYQD